MNPEPGGWVTSEQMQEWLETLTGPVILKAEQQLKAQGTLPPGTTLAWGPEPVDTPLTSTHTDPEDPASAPCRVFWNAHRCDKPRIHVLPGHPAGPAHECGWSGLGGYVDPCTRMEADGSQHWYDDATHEWGPLVGEPWPVHGEDWTG